jgi:tRNA A37 N6-isopentenylltransferase MiaA
MVRAEGRTSIYSGRETDLKLKKPEKPELQKPETRPVMQPVMQARCNALDEFRHLFKTNGFQFAKSQSDFLQVENQVPMEILKAMTMQLCDIHKMMPRNLVETVAS